MPKNKLTPEQKALYYKLTSLQKHCANAFILGKSQEKSYLIACKKLKKKPANGTRSAGNALLTKPDVLAYIRSVKDPIEEDAAVSTIMTRDEMLEEYTLEARASLSDLMEFREGIVGFENNEEQAPIEGMLLLFKDSNKINPEHLKLISEISVSAKGVVKIKMRDSQNAKKQMALLQGFEAALKFKNVTSDEELTPWSDVKAGIDT